MNGMDQQDMELQIWEYIDGTCSQESKSRIAGLIATNTAWAVAYEQLMALHTTLPHQVYIDQPSLRFSKNVMEAIDHLPVAPATRRYINPMITKGIYAFFILSFIAVLTYALMVADWQSKDILLPRFDFSQVLNSSIFHIIAWVNIVLGLLLLDMFLRKRKMSSSSPGQA